MKFKIVLFCFLAFALPLFAFSQAESSIDDRAKFLSEQERSSFTAYVDELYEKTHFSLYLYTASSEVRDPKPIADSLLNAGLENDSLRAVIFVDGTSHYRYLSISPAEVYFECCRGASRAKISAAGISQGPLRSRYYRFWRGTCKKRRPFARRPFAIPLTAPDKRWTPGHRLVLDSCGRRDGHHRLYVFCPSKSSCSTSGTDSGIRRIPSPKI